MKAKFLGLLMAGAFVAAPLTAAQAAVVYNYSDNATNFTGQYRGVSTLSLNFNAASGGAANIAFQIFGARSVDGQNAWEDDFTVALNGVNVFQGTFGMSGTGANVVYLNTLGWSWATTANPGRFQGGFTDVSGGANLLAGLNTFTITFSSPGKGNGPTHDQGTQDESWALNNLSIDLAAVPLPATLPLLLAGVGGFTTLRRRRKQGRKQA